MLQGWYEETGPIEFKLYHTSIASRDKKITISLPHTIVNPVSQLPIYAGRPNVCSASLHVE